MAVPRHDRTWTSWLSPPLPERGRSDKGVPVPVPPVSHPKLGPLTWNAALRAYEGRVKSPERSTLRVWLFPLDNFRSSAAVDDPIPGLDGFLDRAAQRLASMLARLDALKQTAVECLLDTYREDWRGGPTDDEHSDEDGAESDEEETDDADADDAEMDEEAFKAKLRLQSVSIPTDSSADVTFADSGLFRGHVVRVHVDKSG